MKFFRKPLVAVIVLAAGVMAGLAAEWGCQRPGVARRDGPCKVDLTGTWSTVDQTPNINDLAPRELTYSIKDEGERIIIKPLFPIGGPNSGYGPFNVVVTRKGDKDPTGFAETTYTHQADQGGPAGKTCALKFASALEACTEKTVLLAGETAFKLQPETCEVKRSGEMARTPLYRMASKTKSAQK